MRQRRQPSTVLRDVQAWRGISVDRLAPSGVLNLLLGALFAASAQPQQLWARRRQTGTTCLLIGDLDRAFGPAAGLAFVEDLVRLRRAGAAGADRVIGVGMDSTELGIDSTTFLPA